MGRAWHEGGKGAANRMVSVHDLVDVARWLVTTDRGEEEEDNDGRCWTTSPEMLAVEGRSAGGLLVAAAVNEAPSLFRAAMLGVPFLDPLCSMADATLPLTAVERDEWGDPHHSLVDFDHMRRWSPLQNVPTESHRSITSAGTCYSYPNILMVGGLHDSRVPFWEPLKYAATVRHAAATVARLSSSLLSSSPPPQPCRVYVKIDTGAGHSFGGDRLKHFRELSFIYAFLLDQIGAGSGGTAAARCCRHPESDSRENSPPPNPCQTMMLGYDG